MTALDTDRFLPALDRLRDLAAWQRFSAHLAKARLHRQFLRSVEDLEPYLLRDVGLDPEQVRRMIAQDRLRAWWRLA
ncbi:hypothetical protein [Microvirga massiliensis]|uniref:hypothetical protein n=1 Tax=Microvirga massiliensis TaxID=1033741 RepID=UPI00062B4BDF|nr:hypothetical protein [Microvirga massiliensis]